jgi:hypothetical protein
MQTLLTVAILVGGFLKKKLSPSMKSGKGPYADVDAEDGSTWFMCKRAGRKYDY